ncbi:MAG: ATP-binding cassette domain-containing protein, partial [Pseudomonadota bacterium]|nr:ATP-binding cassette domain-containing protein [Pseudomonadota bacterium]
VAALIGGRDRILGAVIGALLVVHLPEWLRLFDVYYLAIYGVALLAVIILAPAGLAGLLPATGTRPPNDPASPPRRWQGGSLDAQDLRKRFGGVVAVDGVDIVLPTGRITGIIGPNGSGKTTLLNLITGLVAADDGSVTIDRARLDPMAADQRARAGLARGFQHPEVDGEQTVWAAVMAAQPLNRSMARARAQGAAALAAMDLGGWSRAINDLTPAECRRLDIARALANRPRVLLLDEPAAGLTDGEQTALAHDLRRLADGGLTVAVVEHGMRFLLPLADRVICLDRGRVIAVGTPAEVVAAPAVIDSYLGREAGAAATNLLGGA